MNEFIFYSEAPPNFAFPRTVRRLPFAVHIFIVSL